ncbi:MAG TPA: HU family DNA-binding protein [Gemmataceae bacterium]
MTKKDIVRQISERAGLTQLKTKEIVQWTFDAIVETLVQEGRIELRNFGVFEVRKREARKARNPKTDETVFVGPKLVVTFQPGKEMEQRVRDEGKVFHKPRRRRRGQQPSGDSEPEGTLPASEGEETLVASGTSSGTESDGRGARPGRR